MGKKVTPKEVAAALENDENYRKFQRDIEHREADLKQLKAALETLEIDKRNELQWARDFGAPNPPAEPYPECSKQDA